MGIGSREFFHWSPGFAYKFCHVPFSFIRTQLICFYYTSGKTDLGSLVWFRTPVVQCVLDLSGLVCFLDLGEPVCFWTSVVQCVFRTSVVRCVSDLSSLVCFQTSVVRCVSDLGGLVCFWTLMVQCIFGPRWSIVFWTSVVNYLSAVLDLSQWSVHLLV